MFKSYYPKEDEYQHDWFVVDAKGQTLGRLATRIARVMLGKHKPTFTPGAPVGDYVIVVNAGGVTVTGTKTSSRLNTKRYYHHSGYPGGMKSISLRDQLQTRPDRAIRAAVWGMLPHNRMGRALLKRLKIYGGAEHPHTSQNAQPLP
ncbi:MAG: 50S ribosomal protein L13 [Chloroflexota bacterium]